MDSAYQHLKSRIDCELRVDNIKGLKFLCEPNLGAKKSAANFSTGFEIFDALEKNGQLNENSLTFLWELLIIIGRVDLASLINPHCDIARNNCRYVDRFRLMLYSLSEELTSDEVLRLRYLYNKVPKRVTIEDGLDLFLVMLQHKAVTPTEIRLLEQMLVELHRTDLHEIIYCFRAEHGQVNCSLPIIEVFPMSPESSDLDNEKLAAQMSEINIAKDEEPMDHGQLLDSSSYGNNLISELELHQKEHYPSGNQPFFPGSLLSSEHSDIPNISVSTQSAQIYVARPEPVGKTAGPNSGAGSMSDDEGYTPLECYKMDANPRGICVVIDNQTFRPNPSDKEAVQNLRDREGSNKDSLALRATFERLRFTVEVNTDLTDTEIINVLKEISARDHRQYDCFVCCILTHGGENHLYGVNGRKVWIGDITSLFRAQSCFTLAQKPKLFFLASCRGKTHQRGITMASNYDTDALENEHVDWIPNEADFLFGYATVSNHVSYRSKTLGTFYINELTKVLDKYAHREDLQTLLVRVNDAVSDRGFSQEENNQPVVFKQTPAPQHTLRKQLKFL